jgi:hypothetical protein
VGANCHASKTLGIGARTVIVMSSSGALVSQTNGSPHAAIPLSINASAPFVLWIRDENGNPMPAGTTIAASVSGVGLQIPAPNSDIVPSSSLASGVVTAAANGITVFSYTVQAAATLGTGTITITVTSPDSKTVTRYQISVVVS